MSLEATQSLPSGQRVGDYQIEFLLGTGGMADVYYAIDLQLDRPVALKILRPKLASDETYLQRFQQEAKAAAALVHPNIVQIYSVGQHGDLRYIAQEFVPGANLRHYLNFQSGEGSVDRQLPITEILSILLQTLAALSKSASLGIVHRDIKPENIMLTLEGEVKIADFGLARLSFSEDPRLTDAGIALGTPIYMSPEQIQGEPVDIRSDLYSLGVTLFHILYGQPPFRGETPLALAMQHVQGRLPELSSLRNSVPQSLTELVQRLLAKSPSDRFSSPSEVLDFLHQHRRDDLGSYWPERTVPLPDVARANSGGASQATQKLQALLKPRPQSSTARRMIQLVAVAVWLAAAFVTGLSIADRNMPPIENLLKLKEAVFKGIPRQADAKSQYEWALLDRSSSRIAKWEAVENYFPPQANSLNRLYAGLANLQLARAYQDAGDWDTAQRQLEKIISDPQMQPLVQAYACLQRASIGHGRRDKLEIQRAVDEALRLRELLGTNRSDVEQLDQAVRAMPPDIELYWTPQPNES
jgi:serine/threonine-protein kinase